MTTMCKKSTCDFNAKKVVYKAFVFLGALNSICELDKAGYWTSETLIVTRGRPSVRSARGLCINAFWALKLHRPIVIVWGKRFHA